LRGDFPPHKVAIGGCRAEARQNLRLTDCDLAYLLCTCNELDHDNRLDHDIELSSPSCLYHSRERTDLPSDSGFAREIGIRTGYARNPFKSEQGFFSQQPRDKAILARPFEPLSRAKPRSGRRRRPLTRARAGYVLSLGWGCWENPFSFSLASRASRSYRASWRFQGESTGRGERES